MKQYTIIETRYRYGREPRTKEWTGTLEELIEWFSYTLEVGRSWQHEKGNKKINPAPKTIRSLVTNLNNAVDNAAANGMASSYYEEAAR